jgi:hypothetical protein
MKQKVSKILWFPIRANILLLFQYLLKKYYQFCDSSLSKSIKTYLGHMQPPGVNFTNILWAAFVPKSFRQKITKPNCKHLKAVQRTLVWLSISPIFYKQLFHTKVPCPHFMCLQFGFIIFLAKGILEKKLLIKCWWNWHLVSENGS